VEDPILFILAAIGLLITPGPTNTMLATAGAMRGGRRPVSLLLGEILAYMLSITLIALVIYPLLAPSPAAMKATNIVCAVYLFYAAARLILSRDSLVREGASVGARDVFVATLFNPKGAIFALLIVPYLKDGDILAGIPYLTALAVFIALIGGGWYMLGAMVKKGGGPRISHNLIRRCGGAVLVFYGVMLSSAVVMPLLRH
jgi:threonine/homoserine/homoserine lactone efflux protein